ncbi:hypothetical protein K2Z83_01850 [Oscillochloris sp. ZM17-4]|uniref:hypothetical protein n=1 Tax=Oscillochloris sp. ZM17-4 TaxID=2866714 RepID=UPI001C72D6A3|nr:hypothetical protein [Oscillochloris sp. ZM17-4]MBX0326437.1 hypothetical protein [Oscillochloris sp. ZM17-4]
MTSASSNKTLRRTLPKDKLHQQQDLFGRAYAYIAVMLLAIVAKTTRNSEKLGLTLMRMGTQPQRELAWRSPADDR